MLFQHKLMLFVFQFITMIFITPCNSFDNSMHIDAKSRLWRQSFFLRQIIPEQFSKRTHTGVFKVHRTTTYLQYGVQSHSEMSKENTARSESNSRKFSPASNIKFGDQAQPNFVQIQLNSIGIRFGDELLIRNASFKVSTGDKIGLVGPNGAGKTTQLKVLAGLIEQSFGEITRTPSNLRIAHLRQEFADGLNCSNTLKEEILSGFEQENKLLRDIDNFQKDLDNSTLDSTRMDSILNKLQELQDKAISTNAYNLDSRLKKIIGLMGFSLEDENQLVATFSGGWKMRIGLAKLLCSEPNVLLLDEPTNHLDLDSVIWLEGFLRKSTIPMVIVSHDREFLDQVCNKIIDLEEGETVVYTGNYSKFLISKQLRLENWKQKYEKQTRYIQEEENWIKRSKTEPALQLQLKSRVSALEKFRSSEKFIKPPPKDKKFRFRFPATVRCGQAVFESKGIGHGYGTGKHKILFQNVNFEVKRGDRIGFVGPNGSGKSTLLRLIAGLEKANHGSIEVCSSNVIEQYYAQNQADQLNLESTVLQSILEVAPSNYALVDIRALLSQFMFKGDDVNKKIEMLSGGEKARIALCRMMLSPSNVLLLDEPTNHLDISSKEVLEEALLAFNGAVLIVSHDRYFLSQVANTIFQFGGKNVVRHDCDFHDFIESIDLDTKLKEKVYSRAIEGDDYQISKAKQGNIIEESRASKSKNFGGSGVFSGNYNKGIKNAKRYVED